MKFPRPTSDPFRRDVDAHFALALSPPRERALREHLRTCEPCRARYDRHLWLASLDPKAPSLERRLAHGLGLRPRHQVRRWWAPAALVAAAAAVVVLARPVPPDDGMRARGPAASTAALAIYRVAPDHAPELVDDAIGADDELAFAYANPTGYERLFVFARDEHGHVFWYHPAWTDATTDPAGVPIATTPGGSVEELPQAVKHELDGRELTIHAVFTNEPWTVRRFEQLAAGNALDDQQSQGLRLVRRVRVEPAGSDEPKR